LEIIPRWGGRSYLSRRWSGISISIPPAASDPTLIFPIVVLLPKKPILTFISRQVGVCDKSFHTAVLDSFIFSIFQNTK
jgi:hypothetical protein